MSSEIIHKNIKISGRVQGVGFRYSTKLTADNMDIKGYVKNIYDGSVYIEAEGEMQNVNKFLEWCKSGHGYAVIEDIYIGDDSLKNFHSFEIRH